MEIHIRDKLKKEKIQKIKFSNPKKIKKTKEHNLK
jgi:hypothetical protein